MGSNERLRHLIAITALVLPTLASAQQTEGQSIRTDISPTFAIGGSMPTQLPGFGYVVYDVDGKPVKAFGPETPVTTDNGKIDILGGGLPESWTVKTEDTPTYLAALSSVTAPDESTYTKKIREVVDSINEGAAIVKSKLCSNPARPTAIQVEVVGGFSFGVHGSITSTVDWDLDKMCPEVAAGAE